MTDKRSTASKAVSESARPYRGRRLSWAEFRALVKEAANDNEPATGKNREKA
ncbi:hypothetical protein NKH34_25015 [Mesorhizobium sp. M1148]|uniref:hypothetical protein n=1 Tax=unclassified Mesorhizobium TaxID=325217 RepID=UPI003336E94B